MMNGVAGIRWGCPKKVWWDKEFVKSFDVSCEDA